MSDTPAAEFVHHEIKGWPNGSCVPMSIGVKHLRDLLAELSASKAEVERLKEDAARYRWLRDARYTAAPSGSLVEMWLFSRPTASGAEIDSAIDAARRALDNPAEPGA